MRIFSSLIPLVLAALETRYMAVQASTLFTRRHMTRSRLNSTVVQRELGSQLSNTTTIFGPSDPRFENATARWSLYERPKVQVVVQAGSESDISKIVTYCNENSIEFLTYSRGHGWAATLGTFNGIQINMVNLVNINITASNTTAWFQGGVYDGLANSYLWDKGFVVTTGSCDCVGLLGAGLGGGHGRLEGFYGMVSDNMRQINLVLANGTSIVVNETSHADLLWGMKGAGHNFGIVTSVEINIYPRGAPTWFYKNYVWAGQYLTQIFTALNELNGNGTTPVDMAVNFGNFIFNPSTSASPFISWRFAYRGSEDDAAPYFTSFDAIPATSVSSGNIPYPEIAHAMGSGEQDPICYEDLYERITATAGTQVFNITAEQQIWDSFTSLASTNPSLAATADILHEGYSTAAVDAIASNSSAYPFRADHHLLLFLSLLPPNASSSLKQEAWKWAREIRGYWNDGQPGRLPDAYVNYANGYESVREHYGHEDWRIDRLKGLKAAYDPLNRFRFFNPIVSSP